MSASASNPSSSWAQDFCASNPVDVLLRELKQLEKETKNVQEEEEQKEEGSRIKGPALHSILHMDGFIQLQADFKVPRWLLILCCCRGGVWNWELQSKCAPVSSYNDTALDDAAFQTIFYLTGQLQRKAQSKEKPKEQIQTQLKKQSQAQETLLEELFKGEGKRLHRAICNTLRTLNQRDLIEDAKAATSLRESCFKLAVLAILSNQPDSDDFVVRSEHHLPQLNGASAYADISITRKDESAFVILELKYTPTAYCFCDGDNMPYRSTSDKKNGALMLQVARQVEARLQQAAPSSSDVVLNKKTDSGFERQTLEQHVCRDALQGQAVTCYGKRYFKASAAAAPVPFEGPNYCYAFCGVATSCAWAKSCLRPAQTGQSEYKVTHFNQIHTQV